MEQLSGIPIPEETTMATSCHVKVPDGEKKKTQLKNPTSICFQQAEVAMLI